jgi:hypothetical protein
MRPPEKGRSDISTEAEIETYLAGLPAAKAGELRALHGRILAASPGCRLWFLDGRNEAGKIVANPNIGYGHQLMAQAGGQRRDFYRIGLSANTGGISIYVIGLADKTCLARTFGPRLGKASVTGYCIKFRSLRDIDLAVLDEVIRFGLAGQPQAQG